MKLKLLMLCMVIVCGIAMLPVTTLMAAVGLRGGPPPAEDPPPAEVSAPIPAPIPTPPDQALVAPIAADMGGAGSVAAAAAAEAPGGSVSVSGAPAIQDAAQGTGADEVLSDSIKIGEDAVTPPSLE